MSRSAPLQHTVDDRGIGRRARSLQRARADSTKRYMGRHDGVSWKQVFARLESSPDALKVLDQMEASGGEPDVIGEDAATGQVLFCDCAAESPSGRRSLCYDGEALGARSSWIATPKDVRSLGGALFCDRRYGKVLVYHNGAQSYYAARGLRGLLRV